MKILKFLLLFFSFMTSLQSAEIHLSSDLWCPYACEAKSDKPGFMVEIAREIFEPKGIKVKYEVMNWARAVAETKTGKFDGVVGASKGDVSGFVIPQIPVGQLVNYYWTLSENPWKYTGEKSLNKMKIGFINGYSYGEEVDQLVAKKHPSLRELSGNNVLLRMIEMTETKRLDGFIENPVVLEFNLHKMKKEKKKFKVSSSNMALDPDLYIAFSPAKATSKEYSRMLDEGMTELRKSGKLKIILEKYGLEDWR